MLVLVLSRGRMFGLLPIRRSTSASNQTGFGTGRPVYGRTPHRRRVAVIESARSDRRPIMILLLILRRNNRTVKPRGLKPSSTLSVAPPRLYDAKRHQPRQQQQRSASIAWTDIVWTPPDLAQFHLHHRGR